MPEKLLLLGDEAVALGALHAGLSGVYAYPGTPSTEITEYIQNHPMTRERGVHSDWCTNEKTAMEAALGVSYAGKRALVCMKHVGMNVCADGFMNSAVTGANGGLVVVACDDPSQHSSQNEQDSRFYAEFAQVPCFEPSNQQEAYDMVREAFDYSEENHIPVLMRLPTRMAHSRAVVQAREPRGQNEMHFPSADRAKFWVTLPGISRVRIKELADDQIRFRHDSELSEDNLYTDGPDHSMGIVACGIAYNYLMENYPEGCPYPTLKVTRYPFPKQLLQKITETCKTILVIEEGQPLVEEKLRGLLYEEADAAIKVKGRLDGSLPRTGELNPDHVRKAVGLPASQEFEASKVTVPRPPALCMGCGHRDFYTALNNVLKKYEGSRVFGDIGCYTLGYMSPFNAIHTCVEMGASLTMAIGAANSGVWPSVGVIGDSTFTHSGMTGLLDAVNSGADITLCISDNLTTGMTGGQDSAGTGKLERICEAIGVAPEHIRTIVPLPKNYPEMEAVIDEELNYHGVSVVICRRECIQTAKRHAKLAKKI
ncbi:MAG: indolepyruvate ferredoxin oxidoreductase [Bacteroidales bacterium]|jgi:indolepyruvate ferredoxin oxidoreductase alpha subunit|nr:indolepyruvate ferredoxin oxidoreductase [Bacteroidales bacterium]